MTANFKKWNKGQFSAEPYQRDAVNIDMHHQVFMDTVRRQL
jgi:hypothetical protein